MNNRTRKMFRLKALQLKRMRNRRNTRRNKKRTSENQKRNITPLSIREGMCFVCFGVLNT